ncbi:MAG: hypothetical protein OEY56_09775 [Cyclobacteriaceae bacterium]|nr:hypothetical protein [Cyclobacteriaceae bacterium]
MKNYNFLFFLFFMLIILATLRYTYNDKKRKEEHPMINETATQPDHLISNAIHYFREHQRHTTMEFIEKAILSMKLIEKDADSISNLAIEKAISDLKVVDQEFRDKSIDRDHMQHAFLNALNSLALAQLRVSESYRLNGENENSVYALKYAMNHIQNAMRYANENEMVVEEKLYTAIDTLLENDEMSDNEMIDMLEKIIQELDRVVIH